MVITKVAVSPARMRILVGFEPGEPRFTNEAIAARVLEDYPSLANHSCINSKGPTFSDVIMRTSLAHLLEHLMIAEQSRMASGRGVLDATFVGTTQWLNETRSLAEVQVSFLDDLEAATALSNALAFMEDLAG